MNGALRLTLMLSVAAGLVEPAWGENENTVDDLREDEIEDASIAELERDGPEEVLIVGTRIRHQDPVGIHMDSETLKGLPGVNDDPLAAVATLPGVAVNNDFEGGTAIRGTRPVDNAYRVDFLDVGYLFHFGTGSVVDGDLVQGFTFHAAGYGPRYQNVIGGVVDVMTRDPSKDDVRGMVDVNLVHGGLLFEGPLAEDKRAYFSARASYYDLVLKPFIDGQNQDEMDDIDVIQLPRFWDYRSRYQIDVGKWSRIDVLFDGAMDEVELLYHDETTETLQDPVLAGAHRFGLKYHRQGFVYSREPPGDGWTMRLGTSRNDNGFSARLGGAGDVETRVTDNTFRLEVQAPTSGSHRLGWGLTLSLSDIDYDVLLRDAGCTEFEVVCRFSDANPIMAADQLSIRRVNAFVEDTWSPNDSLSVFAGLAYGGDDYLEETRIEPRAGVVWRPFPRSSLTVSAGGHHQLPAFEYIERELGNPDLTYLTASHYVVSFRHRFVNGWLLRVESYLKESRNLVTADEILRYDNRGTGTAKGLEFLVQGHFGPRWIGWFALSYAESVRHDPDTGRTFDFEYDQPLIASLVGKLMLREGLSISGKAWFHSGPPHTRVLGGERDAANPGAYLPIYGEINGERLPSYFRFDIRVDWTMTRWRGLKVYAEVLNATNRRNVSDYEYAEDYSTRRAVTQIPWFISLGFRKHW